MKSYKYSDVTESCIYIYGLCYSILYDAILYYFQEECHSLIELCRNDLNIFSHAEKVQPALPAGLCHSALCRENLASASVHGRSAVDLACVRAALVLGNLVL